MNIEEIRARHARATKGPWTGDHWKGVRSVGAPDNGTTDICHVYGHHDESESANREFIAHSWADVKWLLSRVAELESKLPTTADGALVGECDVLYCPRCDQAIRVEYDVAYCDTCVNPDDEGPCNFSPLPLMFGQCLSKPKEKKS